MFTEPPPLTPPQTELLKTIVQAADALMREPAPRDPRYAAGRLDGLIKAAILAGLLPPHASAFDGAVIGRRLLRRTTDWRDFDGPSSVSERVYRGSRLVLVEDGYAAGLGGPATLLGSVNDPVTGECRARVAVGHGDYDLAAARAVLEHLAARWSDGDRDGLPKDYTLTMLEVPA